MKRISLILASAMFLVTVLGVCLAIVMDHEMPVMGDCLNITSRSVMCPMRLAEHLDSLKGVLIAQPVKLFAALLGAVLGAGSIVVFLFLDAARAAPKRLWREWMLLAFFLPLRRMFARGILHSRRYA